MSGKSRSRQVIESITRQAADQADRQQSKPVGAEPAPSKKDRSWEQQHTATPMRLWDSDAEWIRDFAKEQGITLDSAGRGLIRAIRHAIEQGWVTFTKDQDIEAYTDSLDRQRTRVQIELRHHWQIPQS